MKRVLKNLCWISMVLMGCEKSDSPNVSVPDVILECEITECNGSVTTGSALVLLSRSGCTNDFDVAVSSTASFSCAADGCIGRASSWIDSSGDGVTSLSSGVYDLCVLVDQDGSGNTDYTSGDIVFEDSILVNEASSVTASGSEWRSI